MMFTEGLDTNALRWIQEGPNIATKEVPYFVSNQRTQIDPISSLNGSRGFGLPPTSKFRIGHLPGFVTMAQVFPDEDTNSGSENDMSTDSDREVYGGRYSLDTSHEDDIVPPVSRYYDPVQGRPQYHVYSSEVSSLVETMGRRRRGNVVDKLMSRGADKNRARNIIYSEDESDDSRGSSEFSTTQVEANVVTLPRKDVYSSDGYSSHLSSRVNGDVSSIKESSAGNNEGQEVFDDDIPSAPPLSTSVGELKQEECPQTSETSHTSCNFAAKPTLESKAHSVDLKDNHTKEDSKSSAWNVCAESGPSSRPFPARLPTFHASSLGPWYSVIAYDACVRLCLNAWAKGCMEAPMFLDSECALLRRTFSLQQVLLQSEEELLVKRSSEVSGNGTVTKPKKMVGKMKVQVRKVRMALDPPTGCNFSSIKPPKFKLETVRRHFLNVQSKLSFGWQAFQRIPFKPRVPMDTSFSRKSLAYMQASTEYIQQVSGLLKTGVSSLCNTSSTNETVQETYSCLLRLKSSAEEDTVRMQPGSDSLGDDLIVEVPNSKGNIYGRAVVQVAISEDPVKFLDPLTSPKWRKMQ